MTPSQKRFLDKLWAEEFIVGCLCGLCGNTGIIHSKAKSPAGIPVSGEFFCICPNGRALKASKKKTNE